MTTGIVGGPPKNQVKSSRSASKGQVGAPGKVGAVLHVLDVAEVAAGSLDEYVRLLVTEVLPDTARRGLEVAGCWTSAREDGGADVIVLLAATNWEAWAAARSLASRDPAVGERARRLRAMAKSATRRFLVPVEAVTE
jgi:hypothetical protein